jgi:hypothetical protein
MRSVVEATGWDRVVWKKKAEEEAVQTKRGRYN